MFSISGTVVRYDSAARIANATVRVTDGEGKTQQVLTDDDGDFKVNDLQPGKCSVVALFDDSFPNRPEEFVLTENKANLSIRLHRLAGEEDKAAGMKFFYGLLIGLGGLLVVYIVLHLIFPLRVAGSALSFASWDKDPWRFLEIILWGLGGVLANKIITCGWYLRSQKFYREGIIMHISHLAANPLLVLVAVILLSLASFNITLANGSEVSIDLSQPSIMVVVAFLLGSSPWPLWNFIEDAARKVTGAAEKK
jgi:hypothetical protein